MLLAMMVGPGGGEMGGHVTGTEADEPHSSRVAEEKCRCKK